VHLNIALNLFHGAVAMCSRPFYPIVLICPGYIFLFLIQSIYVFAHPLRYLHNDLILFYHLSKEFDPFVSRCQTSTTFSWKQSLNNHANSNLNVHLFGCDGDPMSSSRGV
jgi:hypothetical protein